MFSHNNSSKCSWGPVEVVMYIIIIIIIFLWMEGWKMLSVPLILWPSHSLSCCVSSPSLAPAPGVFRCSLLGTICGLSVANEIFSAQCILHFVSAHFIILQVARSPRTHRSANSISHLDVCWVYSPCICKRLLLFLSGVYGSRIHSYLQLSARFEMLTL